LPVVRPSSKARVTRSGKFKVAALSPLLTRRAARSDQSIDGLALSIVEAARIADIVLAPITKVFRVHRQRLILIPDLDEPSPVDISRHDGNFRVGWNGNHHRVLVLESDSHTGCI